jgi:diguanylate cyclase (GGDEF)-like protein/PAS domain S-box-containing protein
MSAWGTKPHPWAIFWRQRSWMSAFEISRRFGKVGLRARLVILVLLAVAPLLALLIAGAIADRQFTLANARMHAFEIARLGAERQSDALQEGRELLSVLRRFSDIDAHDPAACRARLKIVAADHPQFNTIGITDQDGMIWCHSLINVRQAFGNLEQFRQTMEPGAPLFRVGNFVIPKFNNKPTVVMTSPLPNAPDGTQRGMVFASLNLEVFEQVAIDLAGPRARTVIVIDPRTGTVLARAPDRARLVGREFKDHPLVRAMIASPQGGGLDTDGLGGTPGIFGFAPLLAAGPGGAMIAVGLSRADVLAAANWRLILGLSIAVLATVGALGAAWWFGHVSQLKPIRHLVDTAEKFGRGDLSACSAMEPWQAPELRSLGSTLNDMAAAIASGQKKLQDSEAHLRLLADNSTDMIFKLDLDFKRTYVSPASRDILGFEPSELIGKKPANMAHPEDGERVTQSYRDLLAGRGRTTTVNRIQHRDGHWVWIEVHKRALFDPKTGEPVGILGSMRDITPRKRIEDELEAANQRLKLLASQDGLTGLANRRSFDEVFETEWSRAARDGSVLGLIMLDVDNFKTFNDIYGHQAGDDCLCAVARAIEAAVLRPGDFIARYGGEEFVVVLPNTDHAGTIDVAERIRQSVQAIGLEHSQHAGGVVTISAGTWADRIMPPSNPRDALKSADANLYAAKAAGRNRVVHGTSPQTSAENLDPEKPVLILDPVDPKSS